MRIVFMGTPDFAVPCLARLIADGHEIAGVFTQPDKPKGRGYKLAPPPVKELAPASRAAGKTPRRYRACGFARAGPPADRGGCLWADAAKGNP